MTRFYASLSILILATVSQSQTLHAKLQVGAAVVNINPEQFPVIVNGGMLSRTATEIKTTVNARAVVVRDESEQIAIVVVDSCMVPKELLDDAKNRASKETGIPADQILISATHTHTAPSSFGALGTAADLNYVPLLRQRLVEAIKAASENVQPARVGWGAIDAPDFTALRRWVRRPDRIDTDPFGNDTVRANMHSAKDLDNVTGPSGPEDPELSMIAFQALDGAPIAILCNFSMHYFSDRPISADYFGLFSDGIASYAASKFDGASNPVGIMSHGCSGDIWRRDYWKYSGKESATIESFAQGLVDVAKQAYDAVEYQHDGEIQMAEARVPMRYRLPDAQRLKWAEEIVATIEDDKPNDRVQVYAREQVLLHEMQSTEIVVQALRIGDIAIATTPNETYALTGIKLKLQSPAKHTMVIELANGADGYIPPPEQHDLGGYNTWAARSAGLEVQAEPRIVATALNLLEQVCGKTRKAYQQSVGPAARSLLSQDPLLYWRLDEMDATTASDATGRGNHGIYEPGVLFFLPGQNKSAADERFTDDDELNRCTHFAGGRVRGRLDSLGSEFSVVLSIWNGMPNDARETTGWFFSRDFPHAVSIHGLHLGIGGTSSTPGVLILKLGDHKILQGKTVIDRWTWNQVAMTRTKDRVRVFLNGNEAPEIDVDVQVFPKAVVPNLFIGGRSDNESNWEGRIDEVAIFNRSLTTD